MERKIGDEILLGQATLQQAIQSGQVTIQKGNLEQVQKFFGYFELRSKADESIMLVDR
jgi:hypothetical protein